MRKLLIAVGALTLLAGCLAQAKNATTSTSQSQASGTSNVSQNPFNFPKVTCGDKPTGDKDTWYPVFLDRGNLETIRRNFCADATSTVRKDSKVKSVQLASFTSSDRAIEFAKAVGGDVGQPTYPDVASSSPDPQAESVGPHEATNWSDELCQGDRYFPANGASLAVWNSCQYINSNSLKRKSIVLATAKDSENVADSMLAKRFKKVNSKDDFNPLTDQSASACIVYSDKSVACHKGEGSNLSSNEVRQSTVETASSTSSVEAVLTASDPDSQINLRDSASEAGRNLGYGLVGDRVEILEQTTSNRYTWHKVRFPRSGATGWVRGDFVVSASETSQTSPETPTYSSSSEITSNAATYYTPTAATSGGRCNSPDDLDSSGHRCGGRAAGGRASRGRHRR
jgi:hypothetical protein